MKTLEVPLGIQADEWASSVRELNQKIDQVQSHPNAFDAYSLYLKTRLVWKLYRIATTVRDNGMHPSAPIPEDMSKALNNVRKFFEARKTLPEVAEYFPAVSKIAEDASKFPAQWPSSGAMGYIPKPY